MPQSSKPWRSATTFTLLLTHCFLGVTLLLDSRGDMQGQGSLLDLRPATEKKRHAGTSQLHVDISCSWLWWVSRPMSLASWISRLDPVKPTCSLPNESDSHVWHNNRNRCLMESSHSVHKLEIHSSCQVHSHVGWSKNLRFKWFKITKKAQHLLQSLVTPQLHSSHPGLAAPRSLRSSPSRLTRSPPLAAPSWRWRCWVLYIVLGWSHHQWSTLTEKKIGSSWSPPHSGTGSSSVIVRLTCKSYIECWIMLTKLPSLWRASRSS